MIKTLIIYTHLLAACVAVGILLIQDMSLAKTKGKSLPASIIQDLIKATHFVFIALIVLWISGLALVLVGYMEDPLRYLQNEKLWAKFTVVGILTLNGIVLHYFSFPRVISDHGLLGQPSLAQVLIVLTGAISSVSWLFSCYLGIARPWNHTADYGFVMTVYALVLVGACIAAGEVLRSMRKAMVFSYAVNK